MSEQILRALGMAFAMGWQILWPLILGFTLSGVVQAVVSHEEMAPTIGRPRLPRRWHSAQRPRRARMQR